MSKWRKVLLALKVFLPILVKGIIDLWNEILDAYEENNLANLHAIGEKVEEYKKEGNKQC